jgi:hypothetical protein
LLKIYFLVYHYFYYILANKEEILKYPKTELLGISVYSYEYASLFMSILGVFVFAGGMIGMDSKQNQNQKQQ